MSHQVLARKWRPQTFADIVGQEHVVTALVNALKADRLHHAYLFSGTRGVGKTTVARVLAKALTCETGITPEPCGRCPTCQSIAEGRFVDLIEVDAASRTRVEDTRELLENVQYTPTRGRFKIYLIDEVHMLSGHSFNALLKTLEEPPEHVKFLLATTDPQKLPVTVLSRCLQFTLRHISSEKITQQLGAILEQEAIGFAAPALMQLAASADGSLRDALSLLDQAIAYSGGDVTEQAVSQMLGTVPSEQVEALITAICDFDAGQAIQLIHSLTTLNIDFSRLLDQFIVIFHAAAISQAVPEYKQQAILFADAIKMVSEKMAAEDIQLFYQIVLTSRKDLCLAHSPRAGFEMAVLRMIMFRPGDAAKAGAVKRAVVKPGAAVAVNDPCEAATRLARQTPPDSAFTQQAAHGLDWPGMIEKSKLTGVAKALATHCELRSFDDNQIRLLLASEHASLMTTATVNKLTQKFRETYGDNCKLSMDVVADTVDSPARQARNRQAERLTQAQTSLEEDEFVKALKRDMQAQVVPGSIQPKQEDNE